MILIANSQDLTQTGGIGGVKTHVELLCSKLADRKVGFAVRTGLGRNEVIAKMFIAGRALLSGKPLDAYWLEERAKLLRALAGDDKPSLIHAHDPISAFAFLSDKQPLILTVHGPFAEESSSVGRNKIYVESAARIERAAVERANAIIAVDEGQRNLLISKYPVSDKVSVISNAVDTDALHVIVTKTQLSERLQALVKSQFFVLTRRLVPKNGVVQAVQAFLDWTTRCSCGTKLVLVGDGPEKDRILDLIKAHRNGSCVIMLGAMPNDIVVSLLARAKACVVPSVPSCGVVEATSISVLEALALGVPVIGSKIGGIQEIGMSVGGIHFVRPGDHEDLVGAFTDLEQGATVPEFQVEKFRREYGADAWIDRVLALYESVERR